MCLLFCCAYSRIWVKWNVSIGDVKADMLDILTVPMIINCSRPSPVVGPPPTLAIMWGKTDPFVNMLQEQKLCLKMN